MASEEPEDYSKLPLDVKLSHKVGKLEFPLVSRMWSAV